MINLMAALVSGALVCGLVTGAAPAATAGGAWSDAHRSTISWEPCPSDQQPTKECAWVRVPRRYDRRSSGHVRIALARIPATGGDSNRIGSLLWDGGGPGGPSTAMIDSFAARMSPPVRERFDFVAFDPRGIGGSTPALDACEGPWPVRPALDAMPDWSRVRRSSARRLARANRDCVKRNRRIARVMGTNNVVRDLDRMRRAVGDDQLTFWATSYGTRIGYVYALRYPQRVRAMIMDGSIDPTHGYATLPAVGGTSQDNAVDFVRRRLPDLYRPVVRTARGLTTAPIRLTGQGRFTRWDWLDLVGDLLPFQQSWPSIPQYARLVDLARVEGEAGQRAREVLGQTVARSNGNQGGGFSVVNCLDYADRPTGREQTALVRRNARGGALFGGSLTTSYAIGCSGLPVGGSAALRPDPIPLVTTAAQRARLARVPVILANATQDGSTPMTWARRMQRVFGRPMIRYRSGQHVIWGAVRSQCVNRPLDRFVMTQRLPRTSRTCPFVAPAV